jgi:predicted deacylase
MAHANPYPIEFEFADIEPFKVSNTGTDYVYRFDSKKAGPCAMVCALTHGNEASGAVVLAELLAHPFLPRIGSLIVSFNNVAAYKTFNPTAPDQSRFIDEDFNRVWSPSILDSNHQSSELERARQIRPFVEQADFLLDLHSMHEKCPPMLVCGSLQKGVVFGRQIGIPTYLMRDQGHSQGVRMRDYGDFSDPESPKMATLLEAGQHWEKSSIEVARAVTAQFLISTGMAKAADLPAHWHTPTHATEQSPQKVVTVFKAIEALSHQFSFAQEFFGFEVMKPIPRKLPSARQLTIVC